MLTWSLNESCIEVSVLNLVFESLLTLSTAKSTSIVPGKHHLSTRDVFYGLETKM